MAEGCDELKVKTSFAVISAVAAMSLLISPLAAGAQSKWSLSLNPRAGYFTTDKSLGQLSADGPRVQISPGPSAGLALELRTPLHFLSLRGVAERTVSGGLSEVVEGEPKSCGTNCTSFGSELKPYSDGGWVLDLSVDLVAHLAPRSWVVGPYFALGTGRKKYDLGDVTYTDSTQYNLPERSGTHMVSVAFGLDLRFGRARLNLEAADYVSNDREEARNIPAPFNTGIASHEVLHHDMFLSAGVRVPLFGD